MAVPGVRRGSLHACVEHMRPGFIYDYQASERVKEGRQIARILNPKIAHGVHVVLGGDFNSRPSLATLDPIYHLGSSGSYASPARFIESDQFDKAYFSRNGLCRNRVHCRSGAPTQPGGRKIDYIFSSRFALSGVGAFVPVTTFSDHYGIRSTASYALPAA